MLQLISNWKRRRHSRCTFPLYFCTYFLSLSVHISFQTKYIRLFPSSLCTNNSLSLRANFLSFCTVHSSFLSFYTFPFSLSDIFISFLCLNFLSLSVHSLPFFSQGWEFALSLFALLLFCSCRSSQKEQNERMALFTFFNTRAICSLLPFEEKTGIKNLCHTFWLCFYKNK